MTRFALTLDPSDLDRVCRVCSSSLVLQDASGDCQPGPGRFPFLCAQGLIGFLLFPSASSSSSSSSSSFASRPRLLF
jgi:hypothetical protein